LAALLIGLFPPWVRVQTIYNGNESIILTTNDGYGLIWERYIFNTAWGFDGHTPNLIRPGNAVATEAYRTIHLSRWCVGWVTLITIGIIIFGVQKTKNSPSTVTT
jgi:hypothetical protein